MRFRGWLLEEQKKAQLFDSRDCKRAAALYAAGRGSEAEQAIAHLPPEIRHAMMELFAKGFPEPQNMDATVQALIDPSFQRWVQSKLLPMVSGDEGKKKELN